MKDLRNFIVPHSNEGGGKVRGGGCQSDSLGVTNAKAIFLDMIVFGLFSGQTPGSRILDLVYMSQRLCYALHD